MSLGNKNNPCRNAYGKCLDVKITNVCNANCSFCIEKEGYRPRAVPVDELIEAANSLKDYRKILILGGEPFMYPNLVDFVKGLKHKGEIYITTNGSKFSNDVIDELCGHLTGINVSMHHYDEIKNSKIYGQHVSMYYLRAGIMRFEKQGVPVRINCNLCKGGISTKHDVIEMINHAKYLGATSIRFAELQNAEDDYISASTVFDNINTDPFNEGCEQTFELVEGIKVHVRTTCGFCNKQKPIPLLSEEFFNQELSQTKVLYPNGNIFNGWLDTKSARRQEFNDRGDEYILKILDHDNKPPIPQLKSIHEGQFPSFSRQMESDVPRGYGQREEMLLQEEYEKTLIGLPGCHNFIERDSMHGENMIEVGCHNTRLDVGCH